MAFGPDGNLYIADEVNVLKYDGRTGAFIGVFVPKGVVSNPSYLLFSPKKYLYVSDGFNGVLRFNSNDGTLIDHIIPTFGHAGSMAFGPNSPGLNCSWIVKRGNLKR
jgi:hypothetical protein